jgi:hypothetical protein
LTAVPDLLQSHLSIICSNAEHDGFVPQ